MFIAHERVADPPQTTGRITRFLGQLSVLVVAIALFALAPWPSAEAVQAFDIVLRNGRVMDPESGLDAVRNVGITGKRITAISRQPLRGKTEIDATNLVIAPGFIDLHSHGQTPENYRFKAMDGVTTALELEVGVGRVNDWYREREGKSLINFGASIGHIPARMSVMKDSGEFLPRDRAVTEKATSEQQKAIETLIETGLREGGLGMGLGITYTPTASPEEILNLFYLVAKYKRPVFVHVRSGDPFAAFQEVISDSAASGAPLHIVHLNSIALSKTREALRMVEGAKARGLDVTTEAYPYPASMTDISSAVYDGWDARPDSDFGNLLWVATGERLTRASFERYRKQGGMVIHFGNTEEMVTAAMANPIVMVASDGRIENGKGHPRGVGTYARLLGKYCREDKALTLMDGIRKSSLMPAQRLEAMSPQMRSKGRIKVGGDADIVVFDATRVIDRATYQNPVQYSEGFKYVLVDGVFVVREGKLEESATPGKGIRAH